MAKTRKPRKCTNCGSRRIANLESGYPPFSEELLKQIDQGKVRLRGCVVSENDPVWICVDCEQEFWREELTAD